MGMEPGPRELEPVAGTTPGAPRHRLCTQRLVPRASDLLGLAMGWVMGKDPELWALSTVKAEQLMQEGQGVLDLGGQGQGARGPFEMVQGAWEEWGQGLRQVTGMGLGQPMRQVMGRIWGLLREWGQGAKQVIVMV